MSEQEVKEDEISLVDLFLVLAENKKKIISSVFIAAALGVCVSLLLPKTFTAQTVLLMPSSQKSSAMSMLSELGGAASLAVGSGLSLKTPGDLYVDLFKSRRLLDHVAKSLQLDSYYQIEIQEYLRKTLVGITEVKNNPKSGTLVLEVKDTSPEMAAKIANQYVTSLNWLMGDLAVSEAGQRRKFFDEQLLASKKALLEAEKKAASAVRTTGVTALDIQGKAILETGARLRAEIAVQEVKVAAMRGYAAEQNPDLIKAQQQLAALNTELAKFEGRMGGASSSVATEAALDSAKLLKDVKYQEAIVDGLVKQLQLAKLDEARENPALQVVDPAEPPEIKSGPKRLMIVVISSVLGLLYAFASIGLSRFMARYRQDSSSVEKLTRLKSALKWRT